MVIWGGLEISEVYREAAGLEIPWPPKQKVSDHINRAVRAARIESLQHD